MEYFEDKTCFVENTIKTKNGHYITKEEWDGISFRWFFEGIKATQNMPQVKYYVYLVENENGIVKVGRAVNPKNRINTISTQGNIILKNKFISKPLKKEICYEIETITLRKFKEKRQKGEWINEKFNVLEKFVIDKCNELTST